MPKLKKQQFRQLFLIGIMILIGFFVVKQYLGIIEIPTVSRLKTQLTTLESLRNDLKVARVDEEKRQHTLDELRESAKKFWRQNGQRSMADQEITKDFNKLLRRTQLPSNIKIDVQKNKLGNNSSLSEVIIKLELRNVTMKDISNLLDEVATVPQFRWQTCQISPDNPRAPQNVNFNGKIQVLVMAPEVADFLDKGRRTSNTPNEASGPGSAKGMNGGGRAL